MKNQNDNALYWHKDTSKQLIYLVLAFFIITATAAWWALLSYAGTFIDLQSYYFSDSNNSSLITGTASSTVLEEDNSPNTSRLIDGVVVEKELARLVPYAVMMENLRSVRPQRGLSQAAVVYETLVEGGSTRFMAVYDPAEVISEIMPVRSARPYYLEWASEYGALYVHAGGSPKALTVIWENSDINDLEALSRDSVYFWRDTTKPAPHNLVTSSEKMNFALRDKELADKKTNYKSWKYKDDTELEGRGANGKVLSFNFSYGLTYKVDFAYHRDENVYARSNADQPHLDKNTGEQIEVKNVIVQLVEEPVLNGGKGRLDIFVGGEGSAWILRDGEIIQGTWKKESRTDRTLFYDLDGREVEFNRGNTWVHVLPKDQQVTYQ